MVVDGDLADLTPCRCIPHDNLREAVKWSSLCECEEQVLVRSHFDLIDDIVALILQHLRLSRVQLLENEDILHAVDDIAALTIPN